MPSLLLAPFVEADRLKQQTALVLEDLHLHVAVAGHVEHVSAHVRLVFAALGHGGEAS